MSRLDDRAFVLAHDPKGIHDLTAGFVEQCVRAHEIAEAASLPSWNARPDSVILTGLGGSAAGGDFARALFDDAGKAPFSVNRDYGLPAWVGGGSLVFACSYSGNTEETLSAYLDARRKGASVIAVTSGGELMRRATEDGFPVIQVPGGQPPRTALGYMLIPVLVASQKLGLIPAQPYAAAFDLLDRCRTAWGIDTPAAENPTKQLAEALLGKLPLIYGLGGWQALIAGRWKGQLNENAKVMAYPAAFPELCHNEIIGWVGADQQSVGKWAIVLLQDGSESAKMKTRAEVTFGLIADKTEVHHVEALGEALLEKLLSLTYFGDWVSIYLAALKGEDPEKIENIDRLKAELAKVGA